MSVLKKTKVAAGIAAALFATGAAQAATINNDSSGTGATYSKTIVDEVTQAEVTLDQTIIILDATESLNVDDSVTFELNGGAVWEAISSDSLFDNIGAANYSLVSGGPGETFATFRVNDNPSGVGANVTLSNTSVDNSAGGDISITATMSGFVGGIATDLFSSPFTSLAVQSVPMMTLEIDTVGTGTFDVATGFTKLTTGSNTSASGIANVSTSAAAAANTTTSGPGGGLAGTSNLPAADPDPGKTLVMLSGPMASVDSIDEQNGGILTSATCTGGTPTGGTAADELYVDTANDMACAVFEAGTNGPGTTDEFDLEITFDGETTNSVSAYTVAVSRLADGSFAATDVGSGTLFSFGRNGSAFASNSFGPLNKITVTDRSGSLGGTGSADGEISLTVYDKTGALVTCTGLAIDALESNSTVTINGSDVLDACPGGKRIEGTVNSNSILVTNVKTTSDGATATPAFSSGGGTAAQ